MSSASFRKIGFFGPGTRLAASEGPKIAGGASLARRENSNSRPSVKERVLRLRVGSEPGSFQPVRKVAGILGLAWAGPKQASRSPGSTREALGSPRDAPGAPGKPQDQPRNEQREFQENRAFRPWEAFGGPRGTQNRWGGLAGAKGKPFGPPEQEGGLSPSFFAFSFRAIETPVAVIVHFVFS